MFSGKKSTLELWIGNQGCPDHEQNQAVVPRWERATVEVVERGRRFALVLCLVLLVGGAGEDWYGEAI